MEYNLIHEYLSRYDEGTIARLELLQLLFSHITEHPEHAELVLTELEAHREPAVQQLTRDITELLNAREKSLTGPGQT